MFKDRVLLITGGIGSFGGAVLRRFLASDVREIRIFSRDEKKQDDLRKTYSSGLSPASNRYHIAVPHRWDSPRKNESFS